MAGKSSNSRIKQDLEIATAEVLERSGATSPQAELAARLATSPWPYVGALAILLTASPKSSMWVGRNLGMGVGMTAQGIVSGLADGITPEWFDEAAAETANKFRENGVFGIGGEKSFTEAWRDFGRGSKELVN